MLENKTNKLSWWLIISYSIVPLLVSIWSTIHVVKFFELTNSSWLAIGLALSFEIGALAALAGLVAIDKINKNTVWFIFFTLTAFQMMGNTYHAFDRLSNNIQENPYWVRNFTELFAMEDSELPFIKRVIAIISGALLPLISLGFLHILVNYVMVSLGLKEAVKKKIVIKPAEISPVKNDPSDFLTHEQAELDRLEKMKERTDVFKEMGIAPTEELPTEETNTVEPEIEIDNIHFQEADTEIEPDPVIEEEELNAVEPAVDEDEVQLVEEEPITEEQVIEQPAIEEDHVEDHKKIAEFEHFKQSILDRFEPLREPFLLFLTIMFDHGNIKTGDNLPDYSELLKKIDLEKYPQNKVNLFLTLCNYLKIYKQSGTQKVALMNLEEARNVMSNYLSISDKND